MRYYYSIIRFVPDNAKGEFINIGLIVGSDDNNDWNFKLIDNLSRAKLIDDNDVLEKVMETTYQELNDNYQRFNLENVKQMHRDKMNTTQYSYPIPLVAESSSEGIKKIWDVFISEESNILNQLEFTESVLKIFSDYDMYDDLWWRNDDGNLSFYVKCSDFFHLACADLELITQNDIPALKKAFEDCREAMKNSDKYIDEGDIFASCLYAARRRGMKPHKAIYQNIPKELHKLFKEIY